MNKFVVYVVLNLNNFIESMWHVLCIEYINRIKLIETTSERPDGFFFSLAFYTLVWTFSFDRLITSVYHIYLSVAVAIECYSFCQQMNCRTNCEGNEKWHTFSMHTLRFELIAILYCIQIPIERRVQCPY